MEKRPKERMELFATNADVERAQAIVRDQLGEDFFVDYTTFPKNVGVMGDSGVFGHTVLIHSTLENPAQFLENSAELLADVSKRICNETNAACRVLFDVTPAGGRFEADAGFYD